MTEVVEFDRCWEGIRQKPQFDRSLEVFNRKVETDEQLS